MLARLFAIAAKLPTWLRPAAFGASVLLAVVGVRMLFALPQILTQPAKVPEFAVGLLAATAAGAAGGFGYTLLGAPSRRIPLLGPYVAGAREFAALIRLGMSPIEAIRTATIHAASLLGVRDRGALKVGMLADIVGVPGDPLADVRVMERVSFVMKGGIVFKSPSSVPARAQ